MGGAIRAEVRKIFTTRLWWGLLLGIVVVSGGTAALFASLVGTDVAGNGASDNPFLHMSVGTAQLIYSASFIYNLAPLLPLALGVILITQEFRHQTISPTLLATPRRYELLGAKAIAILPVGIVYGLVHVIVSAGFGAVVLGIKGQPTYLGDGQVLRTFVLSLLAFFLWALLGFGFGLLVRNQLAAVFVALGVSFIGHIALSILFGALSWHTPSKFLPDNLSIGMLVTSDPTQGGSSGDPYFHWWASALILLGYGVLLSAIGSWLLNRRDIS